MGDSPQPKPAMPQFEVPDLELEPVPRSLRTAPTPLQSPSPHHSSPNAFDDDTFGAGGPLIELGDNAGQGVVHFGAGQNFDALGGIELEGNAHQGLGIEHSVGPRAAERAPSAQRHGAAPWPSGQAASREGLVIDLVEISLLANYGEPPKSAYLTPRYAYRVFMRQRELKRALGPLEIERERAELERDDSLAELARAVRPEAEQHPQFSRLFAPLVELE